jgi:hypothetical protein
VLVIGLPLLLVASVVGHVAAPARAAELSEGVDFTGLFVCLTLGTVWLGALLLWLARRLLRRGRTVRPRERPRAVEWARVGGVTLPVLGLIALVQWDLGRDEAKALGRRASDLRTIVRALEATEAKAEEFARERERLAERLETLSSRGSGGRRASTASRSWSGRARRVKSRASCRGTRSPWF